MVGESDHNQTTKASHPTSILQFPTLKASEAGELRYPRDERRFLVMIIGSTQASWMVAEGPFEDMGYKKGRACARGEEGRAWVRGEHCPLDTQH